MTAHTLEADSISLEFGLRHILSDIHITCKTGEITGLLGRNGQGKPVYSESSTETWNRAVNAYVSTTAGFYTPIRNQGCSLTCLNSIISRPH